MRDRIRNQARAAAAALVTALLTVSAGCGDDSGPLPSPDAQPPEPDATVAFVVTAVEPGDGSEDVALDQIVRVRFSRPLDTESLDGSAVQVESAGEAAPGRLLPGRQELHFVPLELQPDTAYTVRVSADVRDASGVALEEELTTSFVTGALRQDGTPTYDATANAPLDGRRFVHLTRQVEFVLAGARYGTDPGKNFYVVDPIEHDPRQPTNDELWSVANPELSVPAFRLGAAGNLDDDPDEEVILLVNPKTTDPPLDGMPRLMRLENDGGQVSLATLDVTLDFGGDVSHPAAADLALGDVDGDGRDEIVVTLVDYEAREGWLYVFDDALASHAQLKAMPLKGLPRGNGWTGVELARVVVGNVDDDPEPEIVLAIAPDFCAHNVTLVQIDQLDQEYEDLLRYETEQSACGSYYTGLTLADLDGDASAEIVIANRSVGSTGPQNCTAWIFLSAYKSRDGIMTELARTAPGEAAALVGDSPDGCTTALRPRVVLRKLEVDGDPNDELLVEGVLYELDPDSGAFVRMMYADDLSQQELPVNARFFEPGQDYVVAVDVGDVDGDNQDDIITVSRNAHIQAWSMWREHVGYYPDLSPWYKVHWRKVADYYGGGADDQDDPALVAANIDRDSVVVQPVYADPALRSVAHQRVAGRDQIVALVASPPCYAAPWQRAEVCQTGLGRSVGGVVSLGSELQVSAGVAIGLPPAVGNAVVGGPVAESFARQVLHAFRERQQFGDASPARQVAARIDEVADIGDDLVVFYWVDHHQYRYRVVTHPDESIVGSELTVNVPLTPRVAAIALSTYNRSNGEQLDIDPEVMGHVSGEPQTFLGLGSVPNLLGQNTSLGFTAPPQVVPSGVGAASLVLTFSGEATDGDVIWLESGSVLERCDESLCAGVQFVTEAPVHAVVGIDSRTAVLSSVGAIDEAVWGDYDYEYGLFAYLSRGTDLGSGVVHPLLIVQYYVD